MCWTDDPARDYERWERDQERARRRRERDLPICDKCGEHTSDYEYIDGMCFCRECLEEEEYIEE